MSQSCQSSLCPISPRLQRFTIQRFFCFPQRPNHLSLGARELGLQQPHQGRLHDVLLCNARQAAPSTASRQPAQKSLDSCAGFCLILPVGSDRSSHLMQVSTINSSVTTVVLKFCSHAIHLCGCVQWADQHQP